VVPEPVFYQDVHEPPNHAWRWRVEDVVSEKSFPTRRGAVDDFGRYRMRHI